MAKDTTLGGTYFSGPVQSNDGYALTGITTTPTSGAARLWKDASADLYWWDGTSNEQVNGGGGPAGSLDAAYEGGQSIDLDKGAISISDSTVGALNSMAFTLTGAKSGNILDFSVDAALTGNAIALDMNLGLAAPAIFIDDGAGARTGPDILVTSDSSGTHSVIDINASGSGAVTGFDFQGSYNGSPAGNAISITLDNADNLDTNAILVTRGTGARNVPVLNIDDSSTATAHLIDIDLAGVFTGNVIDIAYGAAVTGDALFVNLDLGLASTGLHIEGSGIRTQPMVEVITDSTSSASLIDISVDGAATGAAAIDMDMNAGVAMAAIFIDAGAAVRTADLVDVTFDGSGNVSVLDVNCTNTGSGNLMDFDISGLHTGNTLDITFSVAASTGNALDINMGTNVAGSALDVNATGARTGPLLKVASDCTDGGTDDHILFIEQTGVLDSNLIQLTYGTAASTGNALAINLGTNLAGRAIDITTAGARTSPVFLITGAATDAGTDDHIFDINQDGVLDSNIFDVTFATGASTGNAINLAMGTNVAGMAVNVSSAATGTSDEGSAFNVAHTGALAAGADVVRIHSTGNISSTSNLLSIEQDTGAGTAGAYGLYINCTGANVEALKVDAGKVVFDETLEVTGAVTLSSTVSYKDLTEVVTTTNIITAAESGSVFFLNSATEFVSTLPAVAAGLHFTFIVSAAPSGASYTVVTNSSANIIIGQQVNAAGAAGDTGTTDDTITFVDGQSVVGDKVEVYSDGTNWFAYAQCAVAAGVTFTTAS